MSRKKLIFDKIKEEQNQLHPTRKELYKKLELHFGDVPIVSLFTSFNYTVMLQDGDAKMLEGVLQKEDLKKGLILFISSPGGDGLAAERIINICKTYSGTGKYQVIVPSKAKSAATMVCLGAEKIIMGKTSELGAVDPQLLLDENGKPKIYSVYRLIENYKKLFNDAINTKGKIEPYLQQLSAYDPRDIADYEVAMEESSDITIKALINGMLSGSTEDQIRQKVELFLKPEKVKTHGRAIYSNDALNCGLNIDVVSPTDIKWDLAYELYMRLDNYVSRNNVAKCIESKNYSYLAGV